MSSTRIIEVERKFVGLAIHPSALINSIQLRNKPKSLAPNCPFQERKHVRENPPFQSISSLPTSYMHDIYYDYNPNSEQYKDDISQDHKKQRSVLMSGGIWVRQRNGLWQAKIKRGGDYTNSKFEEVEGEKSVAECVSRCLENSATVDSTGKMTRNNCLHASRHGSDLYRLHMASNVAAGKDLSSESQILKLSSILRPVADIRTKRLSWLADEKFRIVLDEMDFGHTVGEVELQRAMRMEEVEKEIGGKLRRIVVGMTLRDNRKLMDDGTGKKEDTKIQSTMREMDDQIKGFMRRYSWAFLKGKPIGKLTAYFERFRTGQ